jgi:hypothetical protein
VEGLFFLALSEPEQEEEEVEVLEAWIRQNKSAFACNQLQLV